MNIPRGSHVQSSFRRTNPCLQFSNPHERGRVWGKKKGQWKEHKREGNRYISWVKQHLVGFQVSLHSQYKHYYKYYHFWNPAAFFCQPQPDCSYFPFAYDSFQKSILAPVELFISEISHPKIFSCGGKNTICARSWKNSPNSWSRGVILVLEFQTCLFATTPERQQKTHSQTSPLTAPSQHSGSPKRFIKRHTVPIWPLEKL